ncbi:hypothetical protein D477_012278 [Arthrobacter crystallopoietes BAB-32]|uniref:Uncharacterized protein n=1 Tax=Arthrobacter crystallopoietes BAB-32 TaxID=1246476 RepID=N1V6S2_9MICC|nr:hypothetical protein [Arthrobacter crystallopoietes]EMY33953.1 hypothetical protein D477_012278 [Arthrobacter crystallopoietes BAB-32]
MCYASNRDFGWGFRKEAGRRPEDRRADEDTRVESWTKTDDSEVQAFLDKSTEAAEEPASDRTS